MWAARYNLAMNVVQKAALFGVVGGVVSVVFGAVSAGAQSEAHGRKYVPPPATGHIVIQVEKAYNEKPLENAAVIFHATKNGQDSGNLEIKTNSQGKAIMDLLETGSHVTIQVIVSGYATAARSFDVGDSDVNLLVKMERPQAQVSEYVDNDGKTAALKPGIQEPNHVAPRAAKSTTAVVTGTLKDERGGRIPGGVIRLHPTGSVGVEVSQATDAEGNFKFDHVAPGAYDLQIKSPGYADLTRHVTLGAGDSDIYKETLHPLADPGVPGRAMMPSGSPK